MVLFQEVDFWVRGFDLMWFHRNFLQPKGILTQLDYIKYVILLLFNRL